MAIVAACVTLASLNSGCGKSNPPSRAPGSAAQYTAQSGDDLFDSAVETLMRIDQDCNLTLFARRPFGSREQTERRLEAWADSRDPPLAWEPAPNEAALGQLASRLNQWLPGHIDDIPWQAVDVLSRLPVELRNLPASLALDRTSFSLSDAQFLETTVWLRDISSRAVAGKATDLERASALFDWVVRNIQLAPEPAETHAWHPPGRTLLLGQGTPQSRAWLFMLLARQQGLPVVMLAYPDPEAGDHEPVGLRPWLPALLSDGQLYLYDAWLGLAIPGPQPATVATLEDLIADEGLLRALDLSPRRPYPVKASDLSKVVALFEASPEMLSRRMALLESRLAGERKLVLTVQPGPLEERLRACRHIADVRPWAHPYEVVAHALATDRPQRQQLVGQLLPLMTPPVLWRGRMRHLRGQWGEENSAVPDYLDSRTPDSELTDERMTDVVRGLLITSKQHATYWLGLLSYEAGSYDAAVMYLDELTLAKWPEGPWTDGARYNLARTYEALQQWDKAVELYSTDITSQLHGNRLRGRWLAGQQGIETSSEPDQ